MRILISCLLLALAATSPLSAQPVLTLEAATDREFYRAEAANKIYIATRLGPAAPVASPPDAPSDLSSNLSSKASAKEGTPATPAGPSTVRNFCFVLDRSGSMAGAPVEILRQAMAATLASLADHDVVSIVLFGSEVETLVAAQPRAQLGNAEALLAQIEPAGGAALYDALNQGAAQLRRSAGPATINHLILLTDGPPTKGPREPDDFTKLAEAFTREGITLSTIGLGQDCNEDQLAALARSGHGRFRYADQPEKIAAALQAELAPRRTLLARDAVLTVRFARDCEDIAAYGWQPADIQDETVTCQLPYLFAEQEVRILSSAILRGRRNSYNIATVRLAWNDLASGQPRELRQRLEIFFEADTDAVRKSANAAVLRVSAGTLISEGLQGAIEQLDKGDPRRALRALRNARSDAYSLNYDLEDPQIAAQLKRLETYIAEVEPRGLGPSDRKILRSGLFNQFETPTAEPKAKK